MCIRGLHHCFVLAGLGFKGIVAQSLYPTWINSSSRQLIIPSFWDTNELYYKMRGFGQIWGNYDLGDCLDCRANAHIQVNITSAPSLAMTHHCYQSLRHPCTKEALCCAALYYLDCSTLFHELHTSTFYMYVPSEPWQGLALIISWKRLFCPQLEWLMGASYWGPQRCQTPWFFEENINYADVNIHRGNLDVFFIVPSLIFDCTTLVLLIIGLFKQAKRRPELTLARLILQDGVIYFLVVFAVNTAWMTTGLTLDVCIITSHMLYCLTHHI